MYLTINSLSIIRHLYSQAYDKFFKVTIQGIISMKIHVFTLKRL
jgi:hypothetical protein